MFGIDLSSAALGFAACAVVSITFPKAWGHIQNGARAAVAWGGRLVGLVRSK